ncbi:MAG: DUF885 family protein [Proteobacteria bacterium]|nr:DUF885 family protein [Pseudomonadota bacterium]
MGDGGAVAARGESGPPFPDFDPARTTGPAEIPPVRGLHRLQRGLGPVRRIAGPGARHVHRSVPVFPGRLEGELGGAIRLVVDTGLHSKGWTREQVLEYMDANSSAAEARRVSETERYMAIPGQALAYKIGQLKISELRARAEKELGPGFDVRKFHTAVLMDGALPLDVLEAKVDRWIASQR